MDYIKYLSVLTYLYAYNVFLNYYELRKHVFILNGCILKN